MNLQVVYFLQEHIAVFLGVVTVLGMLIGSFLNVVIHRLPLMMEKDWHSQCRALLDLPDEGERSQEKFNLVVPRSRCPQCGHLIGALENIPLLSYLLQRGKCKHCGEPISLRYPFIELLTAVVSFAVAYHFGFAWQTLFALLLSWSLIALTFIDFDRQLLPDDITLPFLWLGVLLSIFGLFTDLQSSVIGAMAGYLSLWAVYQLFKLLTGKEGMGFGDFKLLAMLGAWLGWQYLPTIILLSSVVGALIGIALIAFRGRDRNIPIPFGPYLAIAGWIALIWGPDINRAYLGWMA